MFCIAEYNFESDSFLSGLLTLEILLRKRLSEYNFKIKKNSVKVASGYFIYGYTFLYVVFF